MAMMVENCRPLVNDRVGHDERAETMLPRRGLARPKILRYEPEKNQVNVEMKTRGRLLGSNWLLDADTLVR
jgi:hypothetical protein